MKKIPVRAIHISFLLLFFFSSCTRTGSETSGSSEPSEGESRIESDLQKKNIEPGGIRSQDAWEVPEYEYATLYLYNLYNEGISIIAGEDKQLNPSVYSPVEQKLTPEDCLDLIKAINSDWQGEVEECFVPHHGVVFYNNTDEPVAWVSICMMCKQLKTWPHSDFNTGDFIRLKMMLRKYNIPEFRSLGEVDQYRKKLAELYDYVPDMTESEN